MEDKINLLKQLGFSEEYINFILKSEEELHLKTEDESKSLFDVVNIKNNDLHNLIIEKAGLPQNVSFIINQR